jgi:drug/metabolite transporter (DMT)-like permease
MKSSSPKFRFCNPKYQWLWSSLVFIGCVLFISTEYLFPKTPDWIAELGMWSACVGLVVFAYGTIAARREWQARRSIEPE